MAINISEEELLGMSPKLLSELQAYLRESRSGTVKNSGSPAMESRLVKADTCNIFRANLVLSNVGDANRSHIGILVEQNGRSYIARKWFLTDRVKEIIGSAVDQGLNCLWRHGHPQDQYFLEGSKERVGAPHIGFSEDHHKRWVFAIGPESRPPRTKVITFHKNYENQLIAIFGRENTSNENLVAAGTWAKETRGGKNLFIHPDDLDSVLKQIKTMA